MLSQNDLQAIKGIVRNEINTQVELIIEKHLKPVKRDIRKIKKDLILVINTFDRDFLKHENRISRLEKHPNLQSL